MAEEQVNYYVKANIAWIKHCAKIVKPCNKTIAEVIAYLQKHYDVIETSELERKRAEAHFIEELKFDQWWNEKRKPLYCLDLVENDDKVYTLLDLQTNIEVVELEPIKQLEIQGYKIPCSERNKDRIAQIRNQLNVNSREYDEEEDEGYVFWDESLDSFYAIGYGSVELEDDLRLFHGVRSEDIIDKTQRFCKFIQLFPYHQNSISFEDFMDDLAICRRYHIYSVKRLFFEMLQKNETSFEYYSAHIAEEFKKQWFERFIPKNVLPYAKKHCISSQHQSGEYLWHVFSYGDLDCIKGREACTAFNHEPKDECVIFFSYEKYAFKIKDGEGITAEMLNQFDEVFMMDIHATWTYVHTHEKDCGPYFYKRNAAIAKDAIRMMMKRPGMYVGANRLDYLMHFINGWHCSGHSSILNEWDLRYDLEYWLFLNESASIRRAASLSGWSLFFMCFGVRERAMVAFNIFLEDDQMTEFGRRENTPSWRIFDAFNAEQKELEDKAMNYDDHEKMHRLFKCILGFLDIVPTEIKVYIHQTTYFIMVRFYFRQGKGLWMDSTTLKDREDYFENLVSLHACAEDLFGEDSNNEITTKHYYCEELNLSCDISTSKYDWNAICEPCLYEEKDCFDTQFRQWKSVFDNTNNT